ncbi:MAG: DUF3224 domain-containing protein [Kineosporiaceae bacterium]
MISTRSARPAVAVGAAAVVLLVAPAQADAAAACRRVEGTYVEHAVSGPDCLSPVGLCIAGSYTGDIRGDFSGRATSIVTTADTPATTVALFTSDSSISARTRGRSGTLLIKNAGAFTANPDGSIVDLQTIVGGTGGLAGASGSLRATGTFSFATGGRSAWAGVVCLP